MEVEEETPMEEGAAATTLPDDEEIHNREEYHQQLRRVVGVGSDDADGDTTPLGFSPHPLDELQALWSLLTAGEFLARVGHFLRIISQIMEEVGYMIETLSRRHRTNPEEEGDETNLVQEEKRRKPGTHRRRTTMEGGKGYAKWRRTSKFQQCSSSASYGGQKYQTRPDSEGGTPYGGGLGYHGGGGKMHRMALAEGAQPTTKGEIIGSKLYGLPGDGGRKCQQKHC